MNGAALWSAVNQAVGALSRAGSCCRPKPGVVASVERMILLAGRGNICSVQIWPALRLHRAVAKRLKKDGKHPIRQHGVLFDETLPLHGVPGHQLGLHDPATGRISLQRILELGCSGVALNFEG